ncbi:MAG: hypothetical protein IT356_02120 [Gemmatimonadaceae bacterium]|nr:hypothetical protein [Gemmatimonadaceae bacterium]
MAISSLLLPVALMLQGQVTVRIGGRTGADSAVARAAQVQAAMEELRDDTTGRSQPVRRIPVTAEHLATAFKDPEARSLVERARVARMEQDTTLLSYDARVYERVSVGLGVAALGRERLAFRQEDAARVQWRRGQGAWVEMTGSRSVVPVAKNGEGSASGSALAPVPYFPGRDNLWVGSGLARAEVDDRNIVHPLATGAEAYYTYASGDSVTMTLPDGQAIRLRELRIVAREPKWQVTVGSFWFDMRTAQLVRAVYRLSAPMDIWATEREERRRSDSVGRRRGGDEPPFWLKPLLSPMKADISGITIEYGLYNQRFWLPRTQAVEGYGQVSMMRLPVTFEQRFRYESVNALDSVPAIPGAERSRASQLRDSLTKAGVAKKERDSLVTQALRARAEAIVKERAAACASSGEYVTYRSRYDGALRVATRIPCDSTRLANSPDLPASIYDAGDELFGAAEREELLKALSFGLQPGWGPQRPVFDYGLNQTRYNRVEGISTAVTATSVLGNGYSASITARGSYADRQLNGELAAWRSNGRTTWRGAAYRRLVAANDWGNPLSFGASLSSLLYARDEGAYFRAWGGELVRTPQTGGGVELRLFGEQQWGDSVHSRWTLFGGGNDPRFISNPTAARIAVAGAKVRLRPQWGLDPDGLRVMADVRGEAATGDSTYARGLFDLTLSGPLGPVASALTVSAGAAVGEVPPQRMFYLGGGQTIAGQNALTAAGSAFWMVRTEIGTRNPGFRTIAFGDLGWAGARADIGRPGRALSGAGVGWSVLDGLARMDIARGIWPAAQWRLDLRVDARF